MLTSIGPDIIESYPSDLLKKGRLSRRSISYHLQILRTMFKKAIVWDHFIKFIQHQLGHASVKTRMDKHGHLLPEVHSEAAKQLDATLFGAGSGTIKKACISSTLGEGISEPTKMAQRPGQSG